jgi:hypothetical protein
MDESRVVAAESDIEHLDSAIGPQLDVRRLQIAMDDAVLVCRFERIGDLPCDRKRFLDRDGPTTVQPLRQRVTLDQFHHEEPRGTRIVEPVDRRNVRVIQRRQDFASR